MSYTHRLRSGQLCHVDYDDLELLVAHRWYVDNHGYLSRRVRVDGVRRTVYFHREIMSACPGQLIDHVDGNPLNNSRGNLRICTPRGNAQNVVSSKRQKRGQFKGVYQHKISKRWCAYICAGELRPNGKAKQLHLGCFSTREEAARAYDRAALKYFGQFAALNLPIEIEREQRRAS